MTAPVGNAEVMEYYYFMQSNGSSIHFESVSRSRPKTSTFGYAEKYGSNKVMAVNSFFFMAVLTFCVCNQIINRPI